MAGLVVSGPCGCTLYSLHMSLQLPKSYLARRMNPLLATPSSKQPGEPSGVPARHLLGELVV